MNHSSAPWRHLRLAIELRDEVDEFALRRLAHNGDIARVAALEANADDGTALRDIVKAEIERAKLPDGLVRPITERVAAAVRRRTGKQQKFSNYQSLALPASA